MPRRLTALALVLTLSLTGCCWEAEPEPDDFWGDELPPEEQETSQREPAQISDFTLPYLSGQTFDPVTCIDGVQQTVGALLYEPLFTLDASFTPQPVLCERSSCDAQALTWTFALRSAVFSDGTALTANDVLAAYRRAAESARYGARFANVASMKAQDAHTLVITLTRSNGSFPALLDVPIVKAGTENVLVPLGTGPYVYTTAADGAALTANPHWQGSSLPLERIALAAVKDNDTALSRVASRSVAAGPNQIQGGLCMRLSVIQMDMRLGESAYNFAHAEALLRRAAAEGADTALLPETWNTGFFPADHLSERSDRGGEAVKALCAPLARELNMNIVAGSVSDRRGGRVYNTAYVFDRQGACLAAYDKTHLFTPMGEHEHYAAGDHLTTFSLDGHKCGLLICYDLRFPELFRTLALQGVELLLLPAQWSAARRYHWETLTAARAIENQFFL